MCNSYGLHTLEFWDTRAFPDLEHDTSIRSLALLDLIAGLLQDTTNLYALLDLVSGIGWGEPPEHELRDVVVQLIESGAIGIRPLPSRWMDEARGPDRRLDPPDLDAPSRIRRLVDPDLDLEFIAVSLHDKPGYTVFADYELNIDGERFKGQLVATKGTRKEPIAATASCSIRLEHIPVPSRPPAARDPSP